MKRSKTLIIGLFLVMSTSAFSQNFIRPSGNIITKEYDYKGFTAIHLSNDFKAFVTFSDSEEQLSIKADDNLFDYITVELRGNVLEIELKDRVNIRGDETLKAYISAKMINDFKASDDSEIYLENKLQADMVEIDLSGDSKLEGELYVSNLDVNLSSDSILKVSGKSDKVDANLKGDSVIKNYDFETDQLEVSLKGDSQAKLTVNKSINVRAAGDSELLYKGAAKINNMKVVGDSEVRKVN